MKPRLPFVARSCWAFFYGCILGIAHITATVVPAIPPVLPLLASLLALAGIYAVWRGSNRPVEAAALGAVAGIAYFTITTHWIGQSANMDPSQISFDAGKRAALVQFLFFPWWALAFWASKHIALRGHERFAWLAFAACFTASDLMLADWIYSIPLAPISAVLLDTPFEIVLTYIGSFGANLAILLTSMALSAWIWKTTTGVRPFPLVLCGALVCASPLLGDVRPHVSPPDSEDRPTVFLAQPNLVPAVRYNEQETGLSFDDYRHNVVLDAISEGLAANASLIALPESTLPFDLTTAPDRLSDYTDNLEVGAQLVVGFMEIPPHIEGEPIRPANSVAIVDHTGIRQIYRKAHLVPFGETMPSLLFALGFDVLAGPSGGFVAGPSLETFTTNTGIGAFTILVCYESLHSGPVSRETEGARWMLNVSSEGLFTNTIGQALLLDYARMRSLETGLPMLRATGTALSAVIDATGTVIASVGPDISGQLAMAPPPSHPTFFRWIGYAWLYSLLLGSAFVLLLAGIARRGLGAKTIRA